MKRIKTNRLSNILVAGTALLLLVNGLEACSKKSNSSKSSKTTTTSQPVAENQPAPAPAPPPVEEKETMQIKRDAAGNYVIQLLLKDLQPVKLMKPVKEGYVVWMVNESNVTTNIGTIEGANTWTDKKDKVNFEATSAVKPVKLFITAETNLAAEKPGTQVVWSTRNF
jgi:hypothetical protein